jgi:hypothetical protein
MAPKKTASRPSSSRSGAEKKKKKVAEEEAPTFDSSFLIDPNLAGKLHRLSTYPIIPGRFVVFEDYAELHIEEVLGPLAPALSSTNPISYYPELIWYFYTNLTVDHANDTISSLVKGVKITLDENTLGAILGLPSEGVTLNDLTLDSQPILAKILLSTNTILPWTQSKIHPIPRIISRILSYNILPKLGSFDYFSKDLSKLLYGIYSTFPINYASVVFSFIANYHLHKFLPFGCFLTKVFQHFDIPLTNETSIRQKELFTSASLIRMQISKGSSDRTMSVYHPPPTINLEDSDEEMSGDDVDPNFRQEVLDRLERLEASQQRMEASQQHLLEKFQTLHLTQTELLTLFRNQFPPPQ